MGKIKKILAVAMISTMAFSMAGCKMISKTPEAIQKTVLATIGNDKILLSDVDNELKPDLDSLKEKYGEDYESKIDDSMKESLKEARTTVLDQLVEEKIMLEKADELGLRPSDEELSKKVDEKIEELTSYYGDEDTLNSVKESYGYTDETFRTFMENQVIRQIVIEDIIKDVTVSDEEIEKYYNENIEKYTTKPSASAKHILYDTEEEAKEAKAAIDAGTTTFDEEYAKYSNNESADARPVAQDLGTVAYDQENYDTDFLAGLKTVGEGQVSDPVKSSFGYHLIYATNVVTDTKVSSLDEVKDSIKSSVEYQKQNELYTSTLEQWKKDLKVKTYEDRL